MDFSEEWKSVFPVGSVFSPPLFVSDPTLGPLVFNPEPTTLTSIFKSPSLSPPFLNPPCRLSLPRFISTTTSPSCPVLPSTASSLSVSLLQDHHHRHQDDYSSLLRYNRLQFLKHPGGAVVFFSTGSNHDEVGFLLITIKENNKAAIGAADGGVLSANKAVGQRIIRILAIQSDDGYYSHGGAGRTIGFLLVCTLYSVHWFRVKLDSENGEKPPRVDYLGCKLFRSCSVAGACWNPHLPEESVVLLEDGNFFVFDLKNISASHCTGSRVKVPWKQSSGSSATWLGCEFSWHPRVLIVASSNGGFLVDWRRKETKITCLVDKETLSVYSLSENDHFIAFSKPEFSDFHFVLASSKMLLLCDIRKPHSPLLQWVHSLEAPSYAEMFKLSELRSDPEDDSYNWSSSSGVGIMLGSFWSGEFSLFCYGPLLVFPQQPFASEIRKMSQSLYAWELSSELLLSGNKCVCERCLVREEFWRNSLPDWINWQEKQDIMLGFGLLNKYIHIPDPNHSTFGGFTLIRVMASGTLELQRLNASWCLVSGHTKQVLSCPDDVVLFDRGDEDYKFQRRFKYIRLNYLRAYLNGTLFQAVDAKVTKSSGISEGGAFSVEVHAILCEKLKLCGFGRFRISPTVAVVFNDVSNPSSVHEIALRKLWVSLPINLLHLAFSKYSEIEDEETDKKAVALEFPVVPDTSQLPPFLLRQPLLRSNKWSEKVQRGDGPLGPVLPLPLMTTLHEVRNGCPNSQGSVSFFPDIEMSCSCDEVTRVAKEVAASIGEEDEGTTKPFFMYSTSAGGLDKTHTSFVTKRRSNKLELVGCEMFDELCPIELKFDAPSKSFSSKEIKAYKMLKRQFSNWQTQFKPFTEFQSQLPPLLIYMLSTAPSSTSPCC